MATRYGQAAIDYWAKKKAATKMMYKVIGVIIVFAIIYAVLIDKTAAALI